MKIIIMSFLLLFFGNAVSQVSPGAFKCGFVMEYVWSKSKNEYLFLEKNEMQVRMVLTTDHIYFQKGANAQWAQNAWTFVDREKKGSKVISDEYKDERDQVIVIDYESSTISYYYHWDMHNETFSNVAVYSISEFDEEINVNEISSAKTEKFTKTYNRVAKFDVEKSKWSQWDIGYNTFVINANNDGDIVHYMGSGETAIYKTTSSARMDETEGNKYQVIEAIDDEGLKIAFQIFDDDRLGIKLIYSNVIFQFSKQ